MSFSLINKDIQVTEVRTLLKINSKCSTHKIVYTLAPLNIYDPFYGAALLNPPKKVCMLVKTLKEETSLGVKQ